MTAHFSTCLVEPDGSFHDLADAVNSSADISPTGSQMPRLVGLAYASRLYRELPELHDMTQFSRNGDEIAFGTIGNASCAEGMFWESVNAAGVLGSPRCCVSIWDDGYGISVPNEFQITKGDLSAVLSGFRRAPAPAGVRPLHGQGLGLRRPLRDLPQRGADRAPRARAGDRPRDRDDAAAGALHLGQPRALQVEERLAWEVEFDGIAQDARVDARRRGSPPPPSSRRLEEEDRPDVREAQRRAWEAFVAPIRGGPEARPGHDRRAGPASRRTATEIETIRQELERLQTPHAPGRHGRRSHSALIATAGEDLPAARRLVEWKQEQDRINEDRYNSHLYSTTPESALNVPEVAPVYAAGRAAPQRLRGAQRLLRRGLCAAIPNLIAFGEDVGKIGDVNQGFAGLQAKYGELRVTDTGIRETTIIGQAIGMAMRGLRPIAEIQYLDYLLYALQILSDDLATLRWRTEGAAEGAGDRAHPRPPPGGHLALGLAHGGHHQPRARHLRLRAAQHDPGGRLLQHAAAVGRLRRSWSRC